MGGQLQPIWKIARPSQSAGDMAKALGVSELVAHLLISRGLCNYQAARAFLEPRLEDMHDPFLLPDACLAVERLAKAIKAKEPVVVYGDYDVDGVSATALLLIVLKKLGATVDYYIPHRLEEGYGCNAEAVKALGADYRLMITVDCGITACDEVSLAKSLGMDVIITDHHLPKNSLPEAAAVINPKLPGSEYPFKDLCGAGVALKLVQALVSQLYGQKEALDTVEELLDIAALGTIADIVPLVGENRIIAKYGLKQLFRAKRPGVRALLTVTRLMGRELNTGHVAYGLAPRINAGGRIGSAEAGVKLLTTESETEAMQYAVFLDAQNEKRRQLEEAIEREARAKLQNVDWEQQRTIVLASEGWHHGVVGIVASRLVERFYRPTVLLAIDGDECRGSARSIGAVHMFNVLSELSPLLNEFGGHAQAAGLSLPTRNLEAFVREFERVVTASTEKDDFRPEITVDAVLALQDITPSVADELKQMEPFGLANPRPVFLSRNLQIVNHHIIGKQRQHLKVKVSQESSQLDVLLWNMAGESELLQAGSKLDLLFHCELNEWRGQRRVNLIGKDWRVLVSELVDRRGCEDKTGYIDNLRRQQRTVAVASYSYAVLQHFTGSCSPDVILADPVFVLLDEKNTRVVTDLVAADVTDLVVYDVPYHTRQLCELLKKGVETVHLIYNKGDRSRLLKLVKEAAIDRELVSRIYQTLMKHRKGRRSRVSWSDLSRCIANQVPFEAHRPVIRAVLAILGELNILTLEEISSNMLVVAWGDLSIRRKLDDSRFFTFYRDMPEIAACESAKLLEMPAAELRQILT